MKVPVRQIAEAVERQGGDMEDVKDLIRCFERMHAGLERANALYVGGDERAANEAVRQVAGFDKPLNEIVRDRQRRMR
jgi:hypothetical protein